MASDLYSYRGITDVLNKCGIQNFRNKGNWHLRIIYKQVKRSEGGGVALTILLLFMNIAKTILLCKIMFLYL